MSYSVHGPICDINSATLNSELAPVVMERLSRSLRNAASLQAETWVLHPGTHGALSWALPGLDGGVNLRSLRKLTQMGRKLGVQVAMENISSSLAILSTVRDFRALYAGWGNAPGLALDLGHSHIRRETEAFMKRLGERIVHVHAHDNKGDFDRHLAGGSGTIPWARVLQSLLDTGFKGRIGVESTTGPFSSLSRLRRLLRSLQ